MSSLYLRLIGYALAALLFGSVGWLINGERWQAKYEALQAGDDQARADGESAVRKALQAQLDEAQAVSATNARVIRELQTQTDAAALERDTVTGQLRRVLTRPPQPSTNCGVPKAGDQPGTAGAGQAGRDDEFAQLLGDAIAECRGNARVQNALVLEITPQASQ